MRLAREVCGLDYRRKCDLALFLSLFARDEAERAGLPVALTQPRGLMDGFASEFTRTANHLQRSLGDGCIGLPPRQKGDEWRPETLSSQLARVEAPSVLIKPAFELAGAAADRTFARLGVPEDAISVCPPFGPSTLQMLLVESATATRARLAGNGDIVPLAENDRRLALSPVDLLYFVATTDYRSHEAALAFDAILLANWLSEEGLDDRFFVNHQILVWSDEASRWQWIKTVTPGAGSDPQVFIDTLRQQLNAIYVRTCIDSIREFFVTRLPTIMRTASESWTRLDWRLSSRCDGCRWLGADRWLIESDRRRVVSRPEHYCSLRVPRDPRPWWESD
jgi:hypothetical protein